MSHDDARVGSSFGHYRIEGVVGRGGMGSVYRALDTRRQRVVALKLISTAADIDGSYRQRLEREAEILSRIEEPHVVPIHDWGEIDGVFFIDMRLIPGQDLRAILRSRGRMDPDTAVDYIGQVASAVEGAHRRGVLHRDIKPENILVTEQGFAYLVDFGIAQSDNVERLTRTGSTIGSLTYMSPERLDGDAGTVRSDVYSLACVLFECVTGTVPFPADSLGALVRATMIDPVPLASQYDPSLAWLDPVLQHGLEKRPEMRTPTAAQFAAELTAARTGNGAAGAGPASGGQPRETNVADSAGLGGAATLHRSHSDTHSQPWYPGSSTESHLPAGAAEVSTSNNGKGARNLALAGGVATVVLLVVLAVILTMMLTGNEDADTDNAVAAETPTATAEAPATVTEVSTVTNEPAPQPAPAPAPAPAPQQSTVVPGDFSHCNTNAYSVSPNSRNLSCQWIGAVADQVRASAGTPSLTVTAYSSKVGQNRTARCTQRSGYYECSSTSTGNTFYVRY